MHNWQFLLSIRLEQTKYIGLERVIKALFLSERNWNTENIDFQGHCIGFQGFIGKNNKFQDPQGQRFKIKAFQRFQRFQGPLAICLEWIFVHCYAIKDMSERGGYIGLYLPIIAFSKFCAWKIEHLL